MHWSRHDFREPDYYSRTDKKLEKYYSDIDSVLDVLTTLTPEQLKAVERLVTDQYSLGYDEGWSSAQFQYDSEGW